MVVGVLDRRVMRDLHCVMTALGGADQLAHGRRRGGTEQREGEEGGNYRHERESVSVYRGGVTAVRA
jgi:hypothetical protein